jgi:hypothetical protein
MALGLQPHRQDESIRPRTHGQNRLICAWILTWRTLAGYSAESAGSEPARCRNVDLLSTLNTGNNIALLDGQ